MIRVKILEPIGKRDDELIKELKTEFPAVQVEVLDTRPFSDEELIAFIKDAQALLLSGRRLSKEVLKACKELKFISISMTGTDHVDEEACQEMGIEVHNVHGYSSTAVAEYALWAALTLARKFYPFIPSACTPDNTTLPFGNELKGKKVGILGAGSIGLKTGELFEALGCQVVFFDTKPKDLWPKHIQAENLEEIIKSADILSINLPLTQHTWWLLNKERLALLKPTAILINTARGAVIDEEALIKMLKEKKIKGAALDVFTEEPPLSPQHPLLSLDNVILTPHIAYRTEEAVEVREKTAFRHLREFLSSLSA